MYFNSKIKSVFMLFPVLGLFLLPLATQASVFSFIGEIFSGSPALAESQTFIESNSQTMALLEAPVTQDLSVKPTSDLTVVGNEALLPEVGPSTSAPDAVDTSSGQISVYTVRSGDTLASVAKMFDVSVNTIIWANDLAKGSVLKLGQSLVILPMSGVMHTVVSGDTLQGIAKKYSGDIAEIADFNDLKINAKLAIGDVIMIPDGEASFSTRPSTTGSVSSAGVTRLVPGHDGPDYQGYYIKPFVGGHKTQGLHGYNSVDYGMPVGTPIYASASGIIIIAKNSGYNGGYGNYVAIQHPNGTQTVYGHMSSVIAFVGQTVTQGQTIGYSGNTGKSTGPHLHFEIRGAKNPF